MRGGGVWIGGVSRIRRRDRNQPLKPKSDFRAEVERASADLVYSSESDRPFEFFSVPFRGAAPPSVDEFRKLMRIGSDIPVEIREVAEFFSRHTSTGDPADTRAYALRPRYVALVDLLRARLEGLRVFRVGKIAIDCYIVGADGKGNLAGLRTIAVET